MTAEKIGGVSNLLKHDKRRCSLSSVPVSLHKNLRICCRAFFIRFPLNFAP